VRYDVEIDSHPRSLTITFPELPAQVEGLPGSGWSWPWLVETSGASCDQKQSVLQAALKVNSTPPRSANLVCHIRIAGYVTIKVYWCSGVIDSCFAGQGKAVVSPDTLFIYSVETFPFHVPSPPTMNSTGCGPPSDPLADQVGGPPPSEDGSGNTGNSPGFPGEGGTGNTG
jgi:hypothetical protein